MKVSEITNSDLLEYLRIDEEESLQMYLDAAKSFVKDYTSLSDEEMDAKASIVPLVYVLVAEYYENRAFTVENNKVNAVISSTLDMYRKNLLQEVI